MPSPNPVPEPGAAPRSRGHGWLAVLVFVALATNAVDWALTKREPGVDFFVYHRAALRLLAGEDLYPAADGQLAYKYAPAFAAVFIPFAALPLRLAWASFNLVSAACLAWAIRWSTARMAPRAALPGHALLLLVIYPVAVQLFRIGQVDALLLALVVASEALATRSAILSGLMWATAAVAKTPFLILALPAAAARQWGRLAACAAGFVAWFGAGLVYRGVARGLGDLGSWGALLSTSTPALLCYNENQSLASIACRYLGPPAAGAWRFDLAVAGLELAVFLGGMTAAFLVVRRDARAGANLTFAVALALAFFLSPLGWRSNLVVMIPLLACALDLASQRAVLAARALAATALGVLVLTKYVLPPVLSVPEQGWLDRRADGLAYLGASVLVCLAAVVHARAAREGPHASVA